jgi:hypothetical protein
VDVSSAAGEAAQQHDFELSYKKTPAARGRSVDAAPRFCRLARRRKELISRNFLKPSDGLEPSTLSLPWRIGAAAMRLRNCAYLRAFPAVRQVF